MKRKMGLCVAMALLLTAATGLAQSVTFQYSEQGPTTLRQEGMTEVLGSALLQVANRAGAGTVSAGSAISFSVPTTTTLNPGCTLGVDCPKAATTVQVACTVDGLHSCGGESGALSWSYTSPQTLSIQFNSAVTFQVGGSVTVSWLRINASALAPGFAVPLTVSAMGDTMYFNTNVQTAGVVSTVPAVTLSFNGAGSELSCLPGTTNFSIVVAENYATALKKLASEGYGANSADTLTIKITNIPKGLTIAPGAPTSTTLGFGSTPGSWTSGSDGSTASFTYTITAELPGVQENATFPFTATASVPLDANQPTPSVATVILGPYPPASTIPLFTGVTEPGTANVLSFSDCKTYVLFPYVSTYRGGGSSPSSSYDTGITISNTSADPFGQGPVAGGATPQSGSCTLTLYPNTGGAGIPYTTGAVPAGGQVGFTASNVPGWKGMMGGYVIGYCNFQNAHAFISVYNNAGLGSPTVQQGYVGLILPNPTMHPRNPASHPQCNGSQPGCTGGGEQLGN